MSQSLLKIYLLIYLLFLPSFATEIQTNIDTLSLGLQKENKHLLLFFHKAGCGFCKKMLKSTLESKQLKKMMAENFYVVDIGIDDEGIVRHKHFTGTKHDYAKSLEISFYPTIGFVDSNNSMVYGTIGYRDKKRFETILKYVYTKAYKRIDLESYQTELDFNDD
jgi:thioredoxin-related protein